MLKILSLALAVVPPLTSVAAISAAPIPPATPALTLQANVRALFQTGQDQQVIAAVNASKEPAANLAPLLFVAAQSHDRLRQPQAARAVYLRLAGYPQSSPWWAIGQSGVLIADRKFPEAVAAANRAVAQAPNLPEAHFGLARALGFVNDYARSAAAFEQAGRLDPNMAYAFYYAGIAYNQVRRTDLVARNFQTFLRLAPQAPERARVESIMRTIRK